MFLGFAKQTEKQPKQIEFRFVSVRTENFFWLFRGHPTGDSDGGGTSHTVPFISFQEEGPIGDGDDGDVHRTLSHLYLIKKRDLLVMAMMAA